MVKPIAYFVRALPGADLARLADCFEIVGNGQEPPERTRLLTEARDAQVLVVTYLDQVDEELASLPKLRHVASYGVGVDHIDLDACRRRGLLVTNTPGVLTDATADMAMALLLAAARRVVEGDRTVRGGEWKRVDPGWMLGTQVTGKTLGIVGFGRIGQAVARRAAGFEMKILYANPREVDFPGAARVTLDELLGRSDFVSLHVPLDAGTENLISRARIGQMKPGVVLVNTARGSVIDEDALVEGLRSGQIGAAGLDVHRDEPRVAEPLRALSNVVLTPHLGSGSRETRFQMSRMVLDEILLAGRGESPRFRVI